MALHDDILNLIINSADLTILREQLNIYHHRDIAECFRHLDEENQAKIYAVFSNEELADIFAYLDSFDVSEITETMSAEKLASIIQEMEPDDAADLMTEYSENRADMIFHYIDEDAKEEIVQLQEYEENTAGSLMNSNFLAIEKGQDIKDLMKKLVKDAPSFESINTTFVVDENNQLLGTIPLKTVIITKTPCSVESIMNPHIKAVNVDTPVTEVVNIVKNYDLFDLPVLENGQLKGIITIDDAMEAVIAEAEEDYAKLAGLTKTEASFESTFKSVQKRIPWLAFLLIMDLLVAVVISQFDYLFALDKMTVLVFFQPIILGLAGNFGTQSLAITIRKITDQELDYQHRIIKHLFKETLLGIAMGLILGLLTLVFACAFLYFSGQTWQSLWPIALVVAISVFASLTISALFGALMPIVLYKIKIDPAVASGPVITTIIDVLAVVIYFTLATLLIYNSLV
ncbi:MAG: magnesium transporter [Bacilli bacterium]